MHLKLFTNCVKLKHYWAYISIRKHEHYQQLIKKTAILNRKNCIPLIAHISVNLRANFAVVFFNFLNFSKFLLVFFITIYNNYYGLVTLNAVLLNITYKTDSKPTIVSDHLDKYFDLCIQQQKEYRQKCKNFNSRG